MDDNGNGKMVGRFTAREKWGHTRVVHRGTVIQQNLKNAWFLMASQFLLVEM